MASLRKFIFIMLMGFIFLPILQTTFHLIKVKPLSGAFSLTDDTTFTVAGWFSEKYQKHKEQYLKDTFGLRNLFIRSHNQIDYSIFRKINSGHILIGKNDELFPEWYLGSYTGSNFKGTPYLKKLLDKMKYLQDTLAYLHKTLLLVITPSKVSFEPENIPVDYIKTDSTNYKACIKLLKEDGLNYIDFNNYFIEQKYRSKYPLYNKDGNHWSFYGTCIAGDSIINKLEKIRKMKISHTDWKDNIVQEEASGDEVELEYDLNLLFPLKHTIMGHPQLKNNTDSSKTKPSVLIIGDSYINYLLDHYNFGANFSSFTFCYYFRTIFTSGNVNKGSISNFALKDAIKTNDIIIIELTEANLYLLDFGFSDLVREILPLDNSAESTFKERVLLMRHSMQDNSDLMATIAEKAKKNKLPLDSMLTLDAMWLVQHTKY